MPKRPKTQRWATRSAHGARHALVTGDQNVPARLQRFRAMNRLAFPDSTGFDSVLYYSPPNY